MQQQFRPRLSALIPEEWFIKESFTFLSPDGQANVIASSEAIDVNIDSRTYATIQGDLLRVEFPEYREYFFSETPVFGNRQGYMRRFEWKPPDGVPVTQMQLYYAEHGRGYTATATSTSANIQKVELVVRQILGQIRLAD